MSSVRLSRDRAVAFAPGNVSGIFKIIPHEDPAKMHSLGWGFTVEEGVTATVSLLDADETKVEFNGSPILFPTVAEALADLTCQRFHVDLLAQLPLSSGFGLSGASTYAALIAANELIQASRARDELALMAHIAEVKNLTGLGDVCSQHNGGCLMKTIAGNPLTATAIEVEPLPIFWRYFSPIRTSEILSDQQRHHQINEAADIALDTLTGILRRRRVVDFEKLTDIALGFATSSGLLMDRDVKRCISEARAAGGSASMIMLGNAVFSTVPFEGSIKTRLARHSARLA